VSAFSERARQTVHISMVGFALLLRVLTWWQAAALAFVALLFNVFVLPRVGGRSLYRPADEARGLPLGIVLYPIAVLLLVIAFPRRLDIAAAAWGILAVGDGSATLVGRAIGGPRIPWNRDKTVAGSAALAILGGTAGVFLSWWTRPAIDPPPSIAFVVIAPIAAAIAAALFETIPIRLDDNLGVPATAALVLWLCSLATADTLRAGSQQIAALAPAALLANAAVAWAGWRLGTVNVAGAVTGAIIGAIIYAGAGLAAWILLLVTFAAASVTSRMGLRRKSVLGIAEERGGRRGPGNAIANCAVAACAAILAAVSPHADAARLALVAALTAGGSDTVASEIGKAWGRKTFLVTGLRRVRPGTPGAVSLEGTAAGFVAACALGAVGIAGGLIPAQALGAVVVAATTGAFVESVLGATVERRGILNNDLLNFVNTAIAAAMAVAIAGGLR
jgi:uncharacterized protein (TIGR00297 family)